VEGHVLIDIHNEGALDEFERRDPAQHDAVASDKLRIPAALKRAWGRA